MIWAGLLAAGLFLWVLARLFRPALSAADAPVFVLERPALPRDLAPVATRVERWRAEGRLSREDCERLMALVREDAEAASNVRP